jgi:hypothetical protein
MKELLMGFIGSLNTGGDANEACESAYILGLITS